MKKRNKQALKIFEEPASDESPEDPFRDDGEYGSDQDYNPSSEDIGSNHSSDTSLLPQRKRVRSGCQSSRKRVKKSPSRVCREKSIDSTQKPDSNESDVLSSSGDNSGSNSDEGSDSGSSSAVSSHNTDETFQPSSELHRDKEEQASSAYNSDSSEEIFPLSKRMKKSFDLLNSESLPERSLNSNGAVGSGSNQQNDVSMVTDKDVMICQKQNELSISVGQGRNVDNPIRTARESLDPLTLPPTSSSKEIDFQNQGNKCDIVPNKSPLSGSSHQLRETSSRQHIVEGTSTSVAHHEPHSSSFEIENPTVTLKSPCQSPNKIAISESSQQQCESGETSVSGERNIRSKSSCSPPKENILVAEPDRGGDPQENDSSNTEKAADSTQKKDDPISGGPQQENDLTNAEIVANSTQQNADPSNSETITDPNQQKAGPSHEIPQQEPIPLPNETETHVDADNSLLPLENSSSRVNVQNESLNPDNINEIVTGDQSHDAPNPNIVNNASNNIRASIPTVDENWQSTTKPIPEFNFNDDTVGVQFPIDANTTAIDVFNYIFPQELIDYIVECTNAYGQELCKSNRPKTRNSRSYSFKPTDREEIKKFLGLCLLVGHVEIPQKRKLFTYSDILYYHPIFLSVMSCRRFEQLLRCLYVAPVNSRGNDKISEFIDALTRNFRICYKPEQELSLDESLLLFRGRLSFRQYIKSKKAKYGIKFYELTSASGYVLNMIMYKGKTDNENVEKGKKLEKTVLRLMRPYLLKGHNLYMDNYYNSVRLSEKLLDLRTHTTGTLRVNRQGNPKELLKKKLRKGQHVWTRKNRVYISKWVDKRPVHMITTQNHPKMIDLTNRRGQPQRKPEEVIIYNKFMSGIDRADQMVSYYSSPRKSVRWYKKVFFHLLDLAVWNSYYIYKKYCKNNNRNYSLLCYREELIRKLIKVNPDQKPESLIKHSKNDNRIIERTAVPGPSSAQIDAGSGGHWPEKIPIPLGSKKRANYLKCKMCWKKKIRRETGLRCKGCDDHPPLCALCFEEWHAQL